MKLVTMYIVIESTITYDEESDDPNEVLEERLADSIANEVLGIDDIETMSDGDSFKITVKVK